MNIVIAPNSFKHSLGAGDVIRHFAAGLRKAWPAAEVGGVPMADGGDGTATALSAALGGRMRRMKTIDPLGRPIIAAYAECPDGVVVIEMAAASGLALLREDERDPLRASTFGTGLMIRRLIERGARRVIVGAGGSATVDGGIGALQAMGARLWTLRNQEHNGTISGGSLHRINKINLDAVRSLAAKCELEVYVDVENPLLGTKGAARVFAPQKGASPRVVETLEKNLRHWAKLLKRTTGRDISMMKGAGAAGGLAFGLAAASGATLRPGAAAIAQAAGLEQLIRRADAVVTGEGEVNAQTLHGKAPAEVARLAAEYAKPCFVVCGRVGQGADLLQKKFPNVILWPIADGPRSLEDSLRLAPQLVHAAGKRLGHTLKLLR